MFKWIKKNLTTVTLLVIFVGGLIWVYVNYINIWLNTPKESRKYGNILIDEPSEKEYINFENTHVSLNVEGDIGKSVNYVYNLYDIQDIYDLENVASSFGFIKGESDNFDFWDSPSGSLYLYRDHVEMNYSADDVFFEGDSLTEDSFDTFLNKSGLSFLKDEFIFEFETGDNGFSVKCVAKIDGKVVVNDSWNSFLGEFYFGDGNKLRLIKLPRYIWKEGDYGTYAGYVAEEIPELLKTNGSDLIRSRIRWDLSDYSYDYFYRDVDFSKINVKTYAISSVEMVYYLDVKHLKVIPILITTGYANLECNEDSEVSSGNYYLEIWIANVKS